MAFDAKRLTRNRTGLGNYSRFVVSLLQQYARDWELILASPDPGVVALYSSLLSAHPGTRMLYPSNGRLQRLVPFYSQYWRTRSVVNDLNGLPLDLYVGLSNELPATVGRLHCPTILTIHDLIYERHPEFYRSIDVKLYRMKYRRSCEVADRIVAVSECTKRDLMALYGVPEERISVLYQGCDPAFRCAVSREEIARVRSDLRFPARYILTVGTVEVRKNAMVLVEALSMLRDSTIHLVVAGGLTDYAARVRKRAESLRIVDRVHIIGGVPFSKLPALYQGAELFAYPSRYEGFGIPVLEALCSGVPAVAATGSCLEESGGAATLYASPSCADEFAEAMARIMGDSDLRQRMVTQGLVWSERFLPQALAQPLIDTYQEVARGGKR